MSNRYLARGRPGFDAYWGLPRRARLLRSNGLSAAVSADDAGGQDPQLQLEGVRMLVDPADETSARQLLAATETPDAHC
jgi:hypothetical protein